MNTIGIIKVGNLDYDLEFQFVLKMDPSSVQSAIPSFHK